MVGAHDAADVESLQDALLQNGPEKLIGADDPRHALQENGPYLEAVDTASAKTGAERNQQKTDVICVSDLDNTPPGNQ